LYHGPTPVGGETESALGVHLSPSVITYFCLPKLPEPRILLLPTLCLLRLVFSPFPFFGSTWCRNVVTSLIRISNLLFVPPGFSLVGLADLALRPFVHCYFFRYCPPDEMSRVPLPCPFDRKQYFMLFTPDIAVFSQLGSVLFPQIWIVSFGAFHPLLCPSFFASLDPQYCRFGAHLRPELFGPLPIS